MAIMISEMVKTMNSAYKDMYNLTEDLQAISYDYKLELAQKVIAMAKEYNPNIIKFIDEIKFNGGHFYLQFKEHALPVGIEFYETDEDVGNEFY